MNVHRAITDLRAALRSVQLADREVAFVPTKGALHEGHLSLVHRARAVADVVVLSIFVNPLQFGPGEDLERYPRDERRDLELAAEAGVDFVFLPSVDEMYGRDADTTVSVGSLGEVVEGAARPGHFDGVATVVVKLFNIVQPTYALFGQKDAQQVAVIKKVVADLSLAVEVVVCPTFRDPDGLALSSRNVYLDATQRGAATALNEALRAGTVVLQETDSTEGAEKVMRDLLTERGFDVDYATVVDPDTFLAPEPDADRLLVIAAQIGATRLIDNVLVGRKRG